MKYFIYLLLLIPSVGICQEPPSPSLELKVEKESYEVKDNVFLNVKGFDTNLRVKVLSPSFEQITVRKLFKEGEFFFQVSKEGKYIVEASDSDEDQISFIDVVNKLPDAPLKPSNVTVANILEELNKVSYGSIQKDCNSIASIFQKHINDTPSQKMINDTFTEISKYLESNPDKDKWKLFFVYLKSFYELRGIPASDTEGYKQLWNDTIEAFRLRGMK